MPKLELESGRELELELDPNVDPRVETGSGDMVQAWYSVDRMTEGQ